MQVNLTTFLLWVVFGCVTAYFAQKRGRNGYGWFLIGLFLGLIGLCLVFILPKKPPVHQEENEPITIDVTPIVPEEDKKKFWYYLDESNKQIGPMSFTALIRDWKEGKVHPETQVWNENLTHWKPFSEFLKKPTSST